MLILSRSVVDESGKLTKAEATILYNSEETEIWFCKAWYQWQGLQGRLA